MLRTANCAASPGSWSELIFTTRNLPAYASSSRSSSGPRIRHGPHQGAQKSTSTGMERDASITSRSKLLALASIMNGLHLLRWEPAGCPSRGAEWRGLSDG
jgi:hypothetical protein